MCFPQAFELSFDLNVFEMLNSISGHLHAVLIWVLSLYCTATTGKDGITGSRFNGSPEMSNKTTKKKRQNTYENHFSQLGHVTRKDSDS